MEVDTEKEGEGEADYPDFLLDESLFQILFCKFVRLYSTIEMWVDTEKEGRRGKGRLTRMFIGESLFHILQICHFILCDRKCG